MGRVRRHITLLLALAVLVGSPPADVAAASCAGGFRGLLKRADRVFVGTVTQQGISTARIDVEQVWRGPDLAPMIVVKTGQDQLPWPLSVFLRSGSSADVALEPGTTYVVALQDDDPQQLRTNSCLVAPATRPLLALAPGDARDPVPGAMSGMVAGIFTPGVALGAGVVITALVLTAVVLRRRHSRRA